MGIASGFGAEFPISVLNVWRAGRAPILGAVQRTKTTKNKTTAAIFAILLGGFGAHKFYLGQTGLEILYLVFCWTFIPAIVAFFEFIIYLTMSEDSFALKYGT